MTFHTLSRDDLIAQRDAQQTAYDELSSRGLKLDLTRGKPAPEQLDLSAGLLDLPGAGNYRDQAGTDVRNYGGLQGLVELREIFADLLGIPAAQLVAGNNSSLTMMHDTLVYALLHGTVDSERPWSQEGGVKFICPAPGYDRHFALLEELDIEMISVPMDEDGPDADVAAALVADDPKIKGIWIVPTYANPTGAVCSADVAARLTSMPTAAPDFRIFWDNAYAVHHLTQTETKSAEVLSLASAGQHPNRVFTYASTSKITLAGAGVAFFGSSPANVEWYLARLAKGSIGPDKVNHLRHALFFGDADGVRTHMGRHRDLIAPKFAAVDSILRERLGADGVATWTDPKGGYFIDLRVPDGTATRVVDLAKRAGVALTPAGAAFPYGKDPDDRHIRIAPTFPSLGELEVAIDALATCVLLAATRQALD